MTEKKPKRLTQKALYNHFKNVPESSNPATTNLLEEEWFRNVLETTINVFAIEKRELKELGKKVRILPFEEIKPIPADNLYYNYRVYISTLCRYISNSMMKPRKDDGRMEQTPMFKKNMPSIKSDDVNEADLYKHLAV